MPGTSVDHVPPITIFTGRQRLQGMEYLACDACHAGTRAPDQVAGFLSRVYPDSTTADTQEEFSKIIRGIANNYPALIEELNSPLDPVRLSKYQGKFPGLSEGLNIGPKMHSLMSRFAARVAFALHFELGKQLLPPSGAVFVRWHSNTELVDRNIDQQFLAALGDPKTLRQGRQSHEGQFEYASAGTPSNHMSAHFASFRLSFAIQAFAARDIADLAPAVESPNRVFRPGFLQLPLDFALRP